jgi:hypothetical protein
LSHDQFSSNTSFHVSLQVLIKKKNKYSTNKDDEYYHQKTNLQKKNLNFYLCFYNVLLFLKYKKTTFSDSLLYL